MSHHHSSTRQHSNISLGLHITPSNELCWERKLGGTAMSKTMRVRCPIHGLVAIKMINFQLIAEIRGVAPTRVWKEMMAEIALANSFQLKSPHILGFNRLTTNVPRTALYAWKELQGMSLARFAFAEERHILQATKFQRFSYLIHRYMLQLCEALAIIHNDGLVHGNCRLENVCLEGGFEEEIEQCANIKLTDAIIGRNLPFDTPCNLVYWSQEMLSGVNTGGILKMEHITNVTIPAENYMLGLMIIELITARRLTEVTLGPVCLQPHILTEALKNATGTCPLLTKVAESLIAPTFKRSNAAQAAEKLREFVQQHKMHKNYQHRDPMIKQMETKSEVLDPFEEDEDELRTMLPLIH